VDSKKTSFNAVCTLGWRE